MAVSSQRSARMAVSSQQSAVSKKAQETNSVCYVENGCQPSAVSRQQEWLSVEWCLLSEAGFAGFIGIQSGEDAILAT